VCSESCGCMHVCILAPVGSSDLVELLAERCLINTDLCFLFCAAILLVALCRPLLHLPSLSKPLVAVRFSPVFYALEEGAGAPDSEQAGKPGDAGRREAAVRVRVCRGVHQLSRHLQHPALAPRGPPGGTALRPCHGPGLVRRRAPCKKE